MLPVTMSLHREIRLEDEICEHLAKHGWLYEPGHGAAFAKERALYTLVKERKFGTGCVELWLRQQDELIAKARALLTPTLRTLSQAPFVFGQSPTLADAALYGVCAMLEAVDASLLTRIAPELATFSRRLEARV